MLLKHSLWDKIDQIMLDLMREARQRAAMMVKKHRKIKAEFRNAANAAFGVGEV